MDLQKIQRQAELMVKNDYAIDVFFYNKEENIFYSVLNKPFTLEEILFYRNGLANFINGTTSILDQDGDNYNGQEVTEIHIQID